MDGTPFSRHCPADAPTVRSHARVVAARRRLRSAARAVVAALAPPRAWTWPVRGPVVQSFLFDPRIRTPRGSIAASTSAAPRRARRGARGRDGHVRRRRPDLGHEPHDRHRRRLRRDADPPRVDLGRAGRGGRRGRRRRHDRPVGRAGGCRAVRPLGVRLAAQPQGYLDPLTLLPPPSRRPAARPLPPPGRRRRPTTQATTQPVHSAAVTAAAAAAPVPPAAAAAPATAAAEPRRPRGARASAGVADGRSAVLPQRTQRLEAGTGSGRPSRAAGDRHGAERPSTRTISGREPHPATAARRAPASPASRRRRTAQPSARHRGHVVPRLRRAVPRRCGRRSTDPVRPAAPALQPAALAPSDGSAAAGAWLVTPLLLVRGPRRRGRPRVRRTAVPIMDAMTFYVTTPIYYVNDRRTSAMPTRRSRPTSSCAITSSAARRRSS